MKKLIGILTIVLVILFTSISASAVEMPAVIIQDVTIGQNQIMLGMTLKDVQELTQCQLVEDNKTWGSIFEYDYMRFDDIYYGYNPSEKTLVPSNVYMIKQQFAGENATLLYFFNNDNILVSIVVVEKSYTSSEKSKAKDRYDSIEKTLTARYNSPISKSINDFTQFGNVEYDARKMLQITPLQAYFSYKTREANLKTWQYENKTYNVSYKTSVVDARQRLVKQYDNSYVDIQHMIYKRVKKDTHSSYEGIRYFVFYSYSLYSEYEVNQAYVKISNAINDL